MKRVGIIGCGRIGAPLVGAMQAGHTGDNSLIAVLTRHQRELGKLESTVDADAFFENDLDLVIDTASPESMNMYGERALKCADLWTVNAAALADADLYQRLEQVGRHYGHRLRVLSGALAGLDGVASISVDENAQVSNRVDVAAGDEGRTLFKGSVREAAMLYPEGVNVAAATALAGPGLDKVEVEVRQPGPGEARTMGLKAQSKYGEFELEAIPHVIPEQHIHMVTACIIAALRRESKVIWVG